MAVHADESGEVERISSVRLVSLVSAAVINALGSLTQATDTSNIRLVFAAVKETILQNALRDSGIL